MGRGSDRARAACWYRADRAAALRSQRWVDDGVDIGAHTRWIHDRKMPAPLDELLAGEPDRLQRPQLGDPPARASHRDVLTAFDPIDDGAAMVAQLSDRHLGHRLPMYHA